MSNDPRYETLRRRAVALRRSGKSTRQIRETLGIGKRLTAELVRGEPPPEWTKRPNAKDNLRARARRLRAQGKSYSEIAAALGVSKSSCSLWLRDMPRPIDKAEQIRRSVEAPRRSGRTGGKTHARRLATKLAAARQIGELTDRDLTLAGAIAYWCEGAKSRPGAPGGRVIFTNSDPALVVLFLRFLDALGVDRSRLRFRLQIHDTADLEEAHRFWEETVGVSARQFGEPTIKRSNPVTNRRNLGKDYRGCLQVGVLRGAELYRRIEGLAKAVLQQSENDGSGALFAAPMTRLRERAVAMRRAGHSRTDIQNLLGIPDEELVDGLLAVQAPAPRWAAGAGRPESLKDQARELRAQGWGYRRIAAHLRHPRAEVREWLLGERMRTRGDGDPRTAGLREYWRQRRAYAHVAHRLIAERAAREVHPLSERELLLLGAVMYWCEGGKDKTYRRRERVCFINSDAALVKFFVAFLESCGVERSRMAMRVHIHRTGDVEAAHEFWAKTLGVERDFFRSPVIKRHEPKTSYRDREYRGCLQVDVLRSRELYWKIEGWFLGAVLGGEPAANK